MSFSEICPARLTEAYDDGWLSEAQLAQQCMSCIEKAIDLSTGNIRTIDSNDEAIEIVANAIGGFFFPDQMDKWQSTTMQAPDTTDVRLAEVAYGYDMNGHSYVPGTEIKTQYITFDCER